MIVSPVHFPALPPISGGSVPLPQLSQRSSYAYERGTWAMLEGLMAIGKLRDKKVLTVWFPDYFCAEPLELFKQFSINIQWYPVTTELHPDWDRINAMDQIKAADAFVLVHYFGFPNDLEHAQEFCRDRSIALIEDCAHVMVPFGAVGSTGIISVFSPWKFLSVPDGGVLSTHQSMSQYVTVYPSIGRWGRWGRWLLKRELQRVCSGMGMNWFYYRQGSSSAQGEAQSVVSQDPSPTWLSRAFIQRTMIANSSIATIRRANFHDFGRRLQHQAVVTPLFESLPDGVVPLSFPLRSRALAQPIATALVKQGIPATCWPRLPEIVQNNVQGSSGAQWLSTHLLFFPIHQHITQKQIEYMATTLITVCSA